MQTTVLIADDNANVRDAWRRLLSTMPDVLVIAEACDGDDAVRLAVKHRPSVVLMDVSMPRMNGFEATRRIRRDAVGVRVIIVSADATPDFVEVGFEAGAAGYVAKAAAHEELPRAFTALARGERFSTPVATPRQA